MSSSWSSRTDVADTRESPDENMVEELKDYDVNVYGYDPLPTSADIKQFCAIPLPHLDKKMDTVIIAVAHSSFKEMSLSDIRALMNSKPVIIDVRGMVDGRAAEKAGCITGSCDIHRIINNSPEIQLEILSPA